VKMAGTTNGAKQIGIAECRNPQDSHHCWHYR
jgi:hypothetical protein